MKLFCKSIALFSFVLVFCCSCMIRQEHHGKELTKEALNKLKINKSTKEEVLDILGTPSSISTFNNNIWYYISLKKKGVSILNPKITDQVVIEIRFKNEILVRLKKYTNDELSSFKFNKQKTEVKGNESGVLKDFVRNLGRYNKDPNKSG